MFVSHFSAFKQWAVVLIFFARNCHCLIDCRDPPFSGEVFVDLPKLQLLSIQNRDAIQTPVRCFQENGTSTCAKQICCEGEVGCCFRDPVSNRQTCGCRKNTEYECTLSAPLALLRSYVCEPHNMGQISMCLRKINQGDSVEASISATSAEISVKDNTLNGALNTAAPLVDHSAKLVGDVLSAGNDDPEGRVLKQFTGKRLEENLRKNVLDDLVDLVIEKRAKGIPYGRYSSDED